MDKTRTTRLVYKEKLLVPTYTVRRIDGDGAEWDINCSHQELQEICDEYKLEKVLKPVAFVSQAGSTLSKTSGDWRNHLDRIKKAHPGSTINN